MTQHLHDYLKTKKVEGKADRTITAYHEDIMLYQRFLKGKALLEANRQDAINWLGQWKSPSTRARRLVAIKSFYDYLVEENVIPESPVKKIKTPRVEGESPISHSSLLTQDELDRLFGACRDSKERAILHLYYSSGMRARELLSLRVRDIDFAGNRAFVKKRKRMNKGGDIKFSEGAKNHLKLHLIKENINKGWIFRDRDGKQMKYSALRWMLAKLCKRGGVAVDRVHPHLFRHMWATKMRDSDVPIEITHRLGGWKDKKMVMRYYHASRKKEDEEYGKAFD